MTQRVAKVYLCLPGASECRQHTEVPCAIGTRHSSGRQTGTARYRVECLEPTRNLKQAITKAVGLSVEGYEQTFIAKTIWARSNAAGRSCERQATG
ncbi:hypothetical protein EVAR_43201_1 [Eumeta japonica]|uniref:Uncharacterized protein n=1 Tax=Eumeta variegata TaxID=151549 RepID=A0A4C1WRR0_EUMVA|nr:hypothetical protein EVAR_43201_1 [Eumeta japonica]